jgi:pimeloyl-ACP methyl ester carboxylesterase
MLLRTCLAVTALALAPAAAAQSIAGAACEPPAATARCGTLTVPEARDAPGGRTIDLALAVLPATEGRSDPDPLLVLLGGPGDAAVGQLRGIGAAFAAINRTRDVVLVDQRGTGRSAPLRCPFGSDDDLQSYLDAFLPLDEMRACARRLAAEADLARYRTRDFVADLEAVRASLGVARWNLHGSSYGTRVALHYLQRHPERIRSAILVGVVPPELTMPMTIGADADRGLAAVAADCRADAGCAAAFPALREQVDSIAQRLERAPVTFELTHPGTGRPVTLSLTRGTFGELVRTTLYSAAGASSLPLAVDEAYGGDYRALVLGALGARRNLARSGVAGLYLAVTCAEDVARVDPPAADASNRATTIGVSRPRRHIEACEGWPLRPDGEEWPSPVPVRVPVLMMVGAADPATPPYWAEVAMRAMENGRLIVVPHAGHGFAGMQGAECTARIHAAFVAAPVPDAVDAACVAAMRRPPFLLRR